MPRPYHSPSSIAAGRECEYAWALRYLDGIRDVEIDYAEIESGRVTAVAEPRGPAQCSYKQRGASLGKAMHATLEANYTNGAPDWTTFPGRVAQAGLHLLPARNACTLIEVESEIGDPYDFGADSHFRRALVWRGIPIVGKRDLVAQVAGGPVVLYDYKTTASIERYAKSPEALRDDVAACAYAVDVMHAHETAEQQCSWIYFETKQVRQAVAVPFVISFSHACNVLDDAATFAKHLDTITATRYAARNTESCCNYSGRPGVIGCSYHISKGGPCDAQPGIGQLVQARIINKGKINMVDIAAIKARLEQSKAAKDAAAPATPPAAQTSATPAVVNTVVQNTVVTAPRGRGRPAKATAVEAAPVEAVEAVKDAPDGALVLKARSLEQAQAECDAASSAVELAEASLGDAKDALNDAALRVAALRAEMAALLGS